MTSGTSSALTQLSREFAATLREGAGAAKAERTRARLLVATARLLNGTAPDQLRVADICKRAGVAHGTFYIYFRDVRAAVGAVLLVLVDHVQRRMLEAAKAGKTDPTRATTAAYLALFEENPGLMRVLVTSFDAFPAATQAFQQLNREWTTRVVEAALRRRARAGRKPPPREELLRRAYALGGMVDQYLIALLFTGDATLAAISKDRDAVIDTLTGIWKRGMEG